MPPIRVKEHEWTTFELQTMLSLMARGMHLTPTGKDPDGKARSATHLNFATEFNKALHGENFREDIEKKDIIRCLERLMVAKKYIVRSGGLMDRQRPGRITRGLRMAWDSNRRLDFDGTKEEWEGGRKEKELEKDKQRAGIAAKLRAINYERVGMGMSPLTQLPKDDKSESEPEDDSQSQDKHVEKEKEKEKEKRLELANAGRMEDNSYLNRSQFSFLSQVQGVGSSFGSSSPPKPIKSFHTSPPPRKQKRPGTGRRRLAATKITRNPYKNAPPSTSNHNNWDGAAIQGIAQSSAGDGESEAYGTYQQVGAMTMENDMATSYGASDYAENAYTGHPASSYVENSYPVPAPSGYVDNSYAGNYTAAYHNHGFYARGTPIANNNNLPYASSPDTSGPETPAEADPASLPSGLGKEVGGNVAMRGGGREA